MKDLTLSLTKSERALMLESGLSQSEANMRIDLNKDKSYMPANLIETLFSLVDYSKYKREGYESGAMTYYSKGYMDGRASTNMLKPMDNDNLANTIYYLLNTIGISFSYHTKFNGLFMNRIKENMGKIKFIKMENKTVEDIQVMTSHEKILDEEIIKILNEAQMKIENLIQDINK